jgi:hypothetical protein
MSLRSQPPLTRPPATLLSLLLFATGRGEKRWREGGTFCLLPAFQRGEGGRRPDEGRLQAPANRNSAVPKTSDAGHDGSVYF